MQLRVLSKPLTAGGLPDLGVHGGTITATHPLQGVLEVTQERTTPNSWGPCRRETGEPKVTPALGAIRG